MSGRRPPVEHRFRKGQSGNPRGRPRKSPAAPASAFDIIMERSLTVTQGGVAREMTVEEALQHKLYQDALAGNRSARREVLKMIARREKWLAEKKPVVQQPAKVSTEYDAHDANPAMLLLRIAVPDPEWEDRDDKYERLKLATWAVQAALSRPGRRTLRDKDVSEIKRVTLNPEKLRWPARMHRNGD